MNYSLQWLIHKLDKGESVKYVFFWGHTNKYNEEVGKFVFSQWFYSPFVVEQKEFKTTEHWMMFQKAILFRNEELSERIMKSKSPGEAKELGRQIQNFDQKIWDENKYGIVKEGNIHKFTQNENLGRFLLHTGDRILVEASPTDTVWGIGFAQEEKGIEDPNTWRGRNLLGFALMETRDFLKLAK